MKLLVRRLVVKAPRRTTTKTLGLEDSADADGNSQEGAKGETGKSRRDDLRRTRSTPGLGRKGSKTRGGVRWGNFRRRALCGQCSGDDGDDDDDYDDGVEHTLTPPLKAHDKKSHRRRSRLSDIRSSICSIIPNADTAASNFDGGGKQKGTSCQRETNPTQPQQRWKVRAAKRAELSAAARRSGRQWMVRRQSAAGTVSTAGTASTRTTPPHGASPACLSTISADVASVHSGVTKPSLCSGLPLIGEEGEGDLVPPLTPPSAVRQQPTVSRLAVRNRRGTLTSIPDGIDCVEDPDQDRGDGNADSKSVCSDLTGPSAAANSFVASAAATSARRGSVELPSPADAIAPGRCGSVELADPTCAAQPRTAPGRRRSIERPAAQGRRRSSLCRIPDGIALLKVTDFDEDDDISAFAEDSIVETGSIAGGMLTADRDIDPLEVDDLEAIAAAAAAFGSQSQGEGDKNHNLSNNDNARPLRATPGRRGSIERPAAIGRRRSSLCRIPDGIALVEDDDISAYAEDSISDIGSVTGEPGFVTDLEAIAAAAAAVAASTGLDEDEDVNHNPVRTEHMRPARAGRRRSSLFSIPDNVRMLAEGLMMDDETSETSHDDDSDFYDRKPAAIAASKSLDATESSLPAVQNRAQAQATDIPRSRFRPRHRRCSDPTHDAEDSEEDDDDGNSVATGRSSIFPLSVRAARRFSLESACSAPVVVRPIIVAEDDKGGDAGGEEDVQDRRKPTPTELSSGSDTQSEGDNRLESEAEIPKQRGIAPPDTQSPRRAAPVPLAMSASTGAANGTPADSVRSSFLGQLPNFNHSHTAFHARSSRAGEAVRRGSSASSPSLSSLAASLANVARQQHERSVSMDHMAPSILGPASVAHRQEQRELELTPSILDRLQGHQSSSSVLDRIQGHQSSSSVLDRIQGHQSVSLFMDRIGQQPPSSILDRIQGHQSMPSFNGVQVRVQEPGSASREPSMDLTPPSVAVSSSSTLDRIQSQQPPTSFLDRLQSPQPTISALDHQRGRGPAQEGRASRPSPIVDGAQGQEQQSASSGLDRVQAEARSWSVSVDYNEPSAPAANGTQQRQRLLGSSSAILDRIQDQQTSSSVLDDVQGHQPTSSIMDRIQTQAWVQATPRSLSMDHNAPSSRTPTAIHHRQEPPYSVLDRIQGQQSSSSILDRIQGQQSTSSILDRLQSQVARRSPSLISSSALLSTPHRAGQGAAIIVSGESTTSSGPSRTRRRNGSAPGSVLAQSTTVAASSLLALAAEELSSGRDVGNIGPPTPLYNAVSSCAPYHAVRSLIDADPSSTGLQNSGGLTPLHCAIERYDTPLAVLTMLLEANPSVAAVRSKRGQTPIHLLWKRFVEPEPYRSEGARQAAARRKKLMETVVSDDAYALSRRKKAKNDDAAEVKNQKPLHEDRVRKSRAIRALYSSVELREFWELMTSFVRAAHTGSLDEGDDISNCSGNSGGGRWRLLHGASAIVCPPLLLRFASALNPEHIYLQDDRDGRMPLHFFAASIESRRNSDTMSAAVARTLVSLHPPAASAPDRLGRLPLSLAVESRLPWGSVRPLFLSSPSALTLADASTGLLPFMTAAAAVEGRGDDANVDVIFRLIRENPLEVMRGVACGGCHFPGNK